MHGSPQGANHVFMPRATHHAETRPLNAPDVAPNLHHDVFYWFQCVYTLTCGVNEMPPAEISALHAEKAKISMAFLPRIVSLFCGAGGLDAGFVTNGFRIELALDHSAAAIDTHQRNFPATRSICADLRQ